MWQLESSESLFLTGRRFGRRRDASRKADGGTPAHRLKAMVKLAGSKAVLAWQCHCEHDPAGRWSRRNGALHHSDVGGGGGCRRCRCQRGRINKRGRARSLPARGVRGHRGSRVDILRAATRADRRGCAGTDSALNLPRTTRMPCLRVVFRRRPHARCQESLTPLAAPHASRPRSLSQWSSGAAAFGAQPEKSSVPELY